MLTAPADGDLLDAANWHKYPAPVFETNASNGRYGPGHNSFTLAQDGQTPLLEYHVRDTPAYHGRPLAGPGAPHLRAALHIRRGRVAGFW